MFPSPFWTDATFIGICLFLAAIASGALAASYIRPESEVLEDRLHHNPQARKETRAFLIYLVLTVVLALAGLVAFLISFR